MFLGEYEGQINPNPDEVENYKYISIAELTNDIKENAANYTEWFKICLEEVLTYLK